VLCFGLRLEFNLERADKVYAWIEHEFARFIEGRLRMARHGILSCWLTPTITSQTRLWLTRAPIPLPIRSQFHSSPIPHTSRILLSGSS
jgi:hypothetical protein